MIYEVMVVLRQPVVSYGGKSINIGASRHERGARSPTNSFCQIAAVSEHHHQVTNARSATDGREDVSQLKCVETDGRQDDGRIVTGDDPTTGIPVPIRRGEPLRRIGTAGARVGRGDGTPARRLPPLGPATGTIQRMGPLRGRR